MSTQAVASFLEQLNEYDVRTELNLKGKTRRERIAAIVQLAEKRGFEFSEADCSAVLDAAKKMQAGELEDAELEAVAGGVALPEGTWTSIKNSAFSLLNDIFGPDCDDDDDDDSCGDYDTDANTAVAGVRG